MAYPVTGSTLNSTISTSLSTQILVKVENVTVGAIQSLSIDQSRSLKRVNELGLDGVLEIVPNAPAEHSATIERIVYDRLRLPEAFARGFINIKAQLIPFDIEIIDRTAGEGSEIVHVLSKCWFNKYSPKYTADNFILQESATIWIEDISTHLGSSQGSAVNGGDRGIPYVSDNFGRERETDAGNKGYRGTMDVTDIMHSID